MFVAIDGPNGVGKTSTIAALVQRLESRGLTIHSIRQPSDTDLGRFIRDAENRYVGLTLATLVVADRIQLMDQTVTPALAAGEVVVTDRHIASTLALQQIDGVDLELLWELNSQVLRPDLSVVLTAPPKMLEERLDLRGRTSRFEHTSGISAAESDCFARASALMIAKGLRVLELSTADSEIDEVAGRIEAALAQAE
jgi:dTMP kinase